jgi:hypothetical protein
LTSSLGYGSNYAEYRAALDAERARSDAAPIIVATPKDCPFIARRLGRLCERCREDGGHFALNSFPRIARYVYDTTSCLSGMTIPSEKSREREELRERCLIAGITDAEMLENFARLKRDPDNAEAFDAVRNWTEGNLLILSAISDDNPTGNGQGKSALAHALTVKLCQERRSARYRTAMGLAADWKAEIAEKTEWPDTQCEMIDVLIVDNLGGEAVVSEWLPGKLLELVDARQRRGLPTIASSRYLPDSLVRHYQGQGADIMSRLSSGRVVQVGGPDRRLGGQGQ